MTETTTIEKRRYHGLLLFSSLIKDGCEWHGDVFSRTWAEFLFVPSPDMWPRVHERLVGFTEGVDYKLESDGVWIA